MPGPTRQDVMRLRRQVALTFPLAFALHDLEEVLAAPYWQRRGPKLLRRRFHRGPERLLDLAVPDARQMRLAIAVVSVGVALVSVSALRALRAADRVEPSAEDRAELPLLQAALAGFTAHGLSHLVSAVGLRAYVPGVVTTPLVIGPYSIWAWRTLRITGLPTSPRALLRSTCSGAVLVVGLVALGHLVGRAVHPPQT